MTDRDEQTYKSIISNLTKNLTCDKCPYQKDCNIDHYLNSDDMMPPCSTLIFWAQKWRELNGKN